MPKYLAHCVYSLDGLKGLIKEGGTARKEAVKKLIEACGGTLETYYYAFGSTDLFMISDVPDNVSVTAASLLANASGASKVTVTVLIEPEEVDQAAKMAQKVSAAYRPPGA